ncbi:hypothetical protein AVEN_159743-1 [Araneus ventricosus]|uniref:Uncharacterized protein n=1 Tax=Araneus ventricosus TaxID=182803 RepID=A0A4Y2QHC6_ARAVE|nr:hypothetical protein AVEN_159743-1 [Araneus ventricosus]
MMLNNFIIDFFPVFRTGFEIRTLTANLATRWSYLLENLPCLKEIVVNDEEFCRDEVRESLLFLQMYMKNAHYGQDRLYGIYNCLFPVLENNCFVIQTAKKCGPSAKDVVLEIINQLGVLEFECPQSSVKDVKEILEAIAAMRGEEIHARHLLKEKEL